MNEDDWKPAADRAMDRYARGDDDAFSELYNLLAPRLYVFVLRRIGDRVKAEDVVQQAFLHMHGARRHFVRGAAVMPWAFAIARRLLIDRFRQSKSELRLAEQWLDGDVPELTSTGSAPDELASLRRLSSLAEQELAGLPDPQRAAFELVQLDGCSMAEAAQILGTTVAAVKMRVHRVCAALRERLGASAMEPL